MASSLVICLLGFLKLSTALPIVDPGLFVISGVASCGGGKGYCLLGLDCTLDEDFAPDPAGHCAGLRTAFTPSAHFVCCTTSPGRQKTPPPLLRDRTEPPATTRVFLTTTESLQEETTMASEGDRTVAPPVGSQESVSAAAAATPCGRPCNSTVLFLSPEDRLCRGTLLSSNWVLTSASCALRVYRLLTADNLQSEKNVKASLEEVTVPVSSVALHHHYHPTTDSVLLPEPNNLGLVELAEPLEEGCPPCLPKKGQDFAGSHCITTALAETGGAACEGEAETVQGDGGELYLTLPCRTTRNTYFNDDGMGEGLRCGGVLAGVSTPSGLGMKVFTALPAFLDWIQDNTSNTTTLLQNNADG